MGSISNLRGAAVVLFALALIVGMAAGSAAAADGDDGLTGDDGLGVDTGDENVTETVEGVADGDVTGTVTETTDAVADGGGTTVSPSDVTGTTVDPPSPVDWEDTADDVPVNYCNPRGRVNDRIPRGEIPPTAELVLSLVIGEVPDADPCDVYNLNDPQFDPTDPPTDPTVGWQSLTPTIGPSGAGAEPGIGVAVGEDWPVVIVTFDGEATPQEIAARSDLITERTAGGMGGTGGAVYRPGTTNGASGFGGEVAGSEVEVDCTADGCVVVGPSVIYLAAPPRGMEVEPSSDVVHREISAGSDGGTVHVIATGDAGSDLPGGIAGLLVEASTERVHVGSAAIADELYPNTAQPPGLVPVTVTDNGRYLADTTIQPGSTTGQIIVAGSLAGKGGSLTLECDSSGCERTVDRPSTPDPPSAPSPPSPPGVPGLPVNPPGLGALADAAGSLPVL